LLLFSAGAQIAWDFALAMAAGQLIGGWVGAHLVLRHGTRLIRPALVLMSLAVSGKLLWEQIGG